MLRPEGANVLVTTIFCMGQALKHHTLDQAREPIKKCRRRLAEKKQSAAAKMSAQAGLKRRLGQVTLHRNSIK